jgi:intracellular septation protein A
MSEVGFVFWTYKRRFKLDTQDAQVCIRSGLKGLASDLAINGQIVARDYTPISGEEAVRNHNLCTTTNDGRLVQVEAGYINSFTVGIGVKIDDVLMHESHPGKTIAYPEKLRDTTINSDMSVLQKNRVPLAIDIGTGLLFFVVAKLAGLTTAALVGAAVGLGLVVLQRFIKTDILGGMVLFGVVMLLLSGGFAWLVEDDTIIKMKSTILGLVAAAIFLTDGLSGGKWVGKGLSRYMPYPDIMPSRLAIGVGVVGAIVAILNWIVVTIASTDIWLFYSTFIDIFITITLFMVAIKWARGKSILPQKKQRQ